MEPSEMDLGSNLDQIAALSTLSQFKQLQLGTVLLKRP